MKARPLLQSLDLGEDVADFDEHLSSYFVETSSFKDVAADRADLILGEKGSGKSAIFRYISNPQIPIAVLDDVDIIPAFNTQGSVIFRRLANYPNIPEEALRFIWVTYIAGMTANHLVHNYNHIASVRELSKKIHKAGLEVNSTSARGLWARIDAILEVIAQRIEIEGEIKFSSPKLPLYVGAKGKLVEGWRRRSQIDPEEILELCGNIYAEVARRCWIVFDRLDEAFQPNRQLEGVALRALLRAHLDISSFRSPVRTKLFLRSDVLDRITVDRGFVNATHLRTHRLRWDREGIIDLIARRILASSAVADFFQLSSEQLQTGPGRRGICRTIFPDFIDHQDLVGWLALCTVDGSEALNPRNVITLLRISRDHQLKMYDLDDPDYISTRSLITQRALRKALKDLSELRLEDTVLAEHSELRSAISALRRKPARLHTADMATALALPVDSAEFVSTLEALHYVGMISSLDTKVITIPPLYRPALYSSIGRSGGKRNIDQEEEQHLQQFADAACSNAFNHGTARLRNLDTTQRNYIASYIRGNYENYHVTINRTGPSTFDDLVVSCPGFNSKDDADRSDYMKFDVVDFIDTEEMVVLGEKMERAAHETGELVITDRISPTERYFLVGLSKRRSGENLRAMVVCWFVHQDNRQQVAYALDSESMDIDPNNANHIECVERYTKAICEHVGRSGALAKVRPMGEHKFAVARKVIEQYDSIRLRKIHTGKFPKLRISPL